MGMEITMNRCKIVILLFCLSFLLPSALESARGVEKETGEIAGASFRIQIPESWNRGLVIYAHGYLTRGSRWYPMSDAYCRVFLERGFALAESGYSRQGWAVEEGLVDTEALRRYFVKKHGKPEKTFITGHSMGGAITLATIELHPDAYDGALPMSAPLIPALQLFSEPMFDMLVTFEALFGADLPEDLKPLVEVPAVTAKDLENALAIDSDLAERFGLYWGVRREDLTNVLGLYHTLYREMVDRAGGNPIDNQSTVYSGFGPIERLNEKVRRYAADPKALAYIKRYYSPKGLIEDPVLALHNVYDPGVPPRLANDYYLTTTLVGCDQWFMHKWVEAEGHCNITPDLIGKAFDQLREWAAEGKRPKPGIL